MVVKALDHVRQCYSRDDGAVIAQVLRAAFARGDHVTFSFADVTDVPSSFVNAAFVSLLDTYTVDWLRRHLTVVDATHQIADIFRRCLMNGARQLQAA